MNTDNKRADAADKSEKNSAQSETKNLIKFDENNIVTTGKDINSKITDLDTDLAQLRMELGTINNSVEEGLDRLGDTDTDLTAKVSETYKRLGEIDNAYKSLLVISSRIDSDIQKLNGDVSTVAEQSASGIKNLEQTSLVQSHEFAQKNQQVASRVNQLVETSKLTSDMLGQKIQSTTDMMLEIEKKVVAEIEYLSSTTTEKTEAIASSVDSNKAKILKLQSIDEAIIRRATTLEISSAELTVSAQHMDASIEQLELSANVMTHEVETLKSRAAALEESVNNHSTMLGSLQKATSDIASNVAALAGREGRHFKLVTAGLIFLLIVTGVIYFAQQNQFVTNESIFAERSDIVDIKIDSLQQQQVNSDLLTDKSIAALESRIEQEIEQKIEQVEGKIISMQDQVQSVDARLTQSSPFSQIGSDNVIHGKQWIAALPAENFTLQLSYASDKAAMYELAQRYNHYLKDNLSYFEVVENGVVSYVLLSGNYATQRQALAAAENMPAYINSQRPVVRQLATIQKYIAQ